MAGVISLHKKVASDQNGHLATSEGTREQLAEKHDVSSRTIEKARHGKQENRANQYKKVVSGKNCHLATSEGTREQLAEKTAW